MQLDPNIQCGSRTYSLTDHDWLDLCSAKPRPSVVRFFLKSYCINLYQQKLYILPYRIFLQGSCIYCHFSKVQQPETETYLSATACLLADSFRNSAKTHYILQGCFHPVIQKLRRCYFSLATRKSDIIASDLQKHVRACVSARVSPVSAQSGQHLSHSLFRENMS